TRSRLSATALSARPTMLKAGWSPHGSCWTCTSTRRASTPSKATVTTLASIALLLRVRTNHEPVSLAIARLCDLFLDHVPHQRRGVDAGEALELLGARGRGDVDLGQPVADHVDA